MLFSKRKGLSPAQKLAQVDSIDDELRNGLWTALQISYWDLLPSMGYTQYCALASLFWLYWHSYFKKPIDTLPEYAREVVTDVRRYFFSCEWYALYDFIEFTVANDVDSSRKATFRDFCNSVLQRENSAYRFVGDHITEITSTSEIQSVEEALEGVSSISGVKAHLTAALELLSDRKNPDYRNSIKESISAVEGISRIMTGHPDATLGEALAILESKGSVHGALKKSFSALYGYTSDADGIRHAMLDEASLTFTYAKYMLVACTAFINYVLGKAADLDLSLEGSSSESVVRVLTQDGSL